MVEDFSVPKDIPLVFKSRDELQFWEKKCMKVKLEGYPSHYRRSTPGVIRELYAEE